MTQVSIVSEPYLNRAVCIYIPVGASWLHKFAFLRVVSKASDLGLGCVLWCAKRPGDWRCRGI